MYMTQKCYLLSKSLLTKIALVAALMSWGGINNVWGDTLKEIIFDGTDSYETNWTTQNFSFVGGELVSDGMKTCILTSNTPITLATTDRIVITATKTSETGCQLLIKTSADGSSYTTTNTFSNAQVNSSLGEIEMLSDQIPKDAAGDYYLQFSCCQINIKSIKIYSDYTYVLSENKATTFSNKAGSRSFKFIYTPKSGWNTICTPFMISSGVSGVQKVFGSSAKVYKFSSFSAGTLSFTSSNYIPSYTPCIVYTTTPQSPGDGFAWSTGTTYNVPSSHRTGGDSSPFNGVYFQGTYVPMDGSMLEGSYGVTNAGQIVNAGSNSSIKGYRAYFTGVSLAGARILVFDDDGETTDLGFVKMVDPDAKDVYNMNGQRVQKGRKGLYVVNGKKVVLK